MSRTHRHCAFTLIELLVVIAILCLLVSILLPSLNRAKQMARSVVCATNLRNIYPALQMYANDNNGWLPCGFYPSPNDPAKDPPTYPFYGDFWNFILAPDHLNTYGWKPGTTYISRDVFFCPGDPDARTRGVGCYGSTGIGSYGLNDTISGDGVTSQGVTTYAYWYMQIVDGHNNWVARAKQFRMKAILSPSKTYLAGDSTSGLLYRNYDPDFSLSPRHQHSANMLYFDGRVELQLWENIPMREWTWLKSPWFNVD